LVPAGSEAVDNLNGGRPNGLMVRHDGVRVGPAGQQEGTNAAILAIASSPMTPGPLGMAPTSPMARAPAAIAHSASCSDMMQQIFTLGG
jgi:hypothetical protein